MAAGARSPARFIAFSRIAINFDRCTIASFPAIPARTDWFTGRYSFRFHGWQPLDPKAVVLAGALYEADAENPLIADCVPPRPRARIVLASTRSGADW